MLDYEQFNKKIQIIFSTHFRKSIKKYDEFSNKV
jgi:hypothetical protein